MKTTLGQILSDVSAYDWRHWVFLKIEHGADLHLSTNCLVLDCDDDQPAADDDVPAEAARLEMDEFLSVADIQDVKLNLDQQMPDATIDEFLRAVSYYYDNDAFLEIT